MGRIWSGHGFCLGGFIRTWLVGSLGPLHPVPGSQSSNTVAAFLLCQKAFPDMCVCGHTWGWGHRGALGMVNSVPESSGPGVSGSLPCAVPSGGWGSREAQAPKEQIWEEQVLRRAGSMWGPSGGSGSADPRWAGKQGRGPGARAMQAAEHLGIVMPQDPAFIHHFIQQDPAMNSEHKPQVTKPFLWGLPRTRWGGQSCSSNRCACVEAAGRAAAHLRAREQWSGGRGPVGEPLLTGEDMLRESGGTASPWTGGRTGGRGAGAPCPVWRIPRGLQRLRPPPARAAR